jgi:preprotein translocase subunit SecE
VNDYVILTIWAVLIGAVFAFLWRRGHLARFATYVAGTREELRKCTWPSLEELKGSTMVVTISTLLLGLFTVVVDIFITYVVRHVSL